jgi:predicted secreted hydrolase
MNRRIGLYFLSLIIVIGLGACGTTRIVAPAGRSLPVISLREAAPVAGFARALTPYTFSFPEDHGAHPDFQSEWWYYTGNLEDEQGRRLGYQFTIFRRALSPSPADRESDLAAKQIYFAHLALSDGETKIHRFADRYSRGAGGLAGATSDPLRIWIEDWSIEGLNESATEIHLQADGNGIRLDLTLEAEKPIVAHGEEGLSPKSELPGNASYYLSYTRMQSSGEIGLDGVTYRVQGESWFDHEWSTSALGEGAVGWDWFGLQLEDGHELMLFTIRHQDGSLDPVSGGTLIYPDGKTRRIAINEFSVDALDTWQSSISSVEYPSGWRILIPSEGLDLMVEPIFKAQEMRVGFTYWEGAVDVEGSLAGQTIRGYGYTELTGYAESMAGIF